MLEFSYRVQHKIQGIVIGSIHFLVALKTQAVLYALYKEEEREAANLIWVLRVEYIFFPLWA